MLFKLFNITLFMAVVLISDKIYSEPDIQFLQKKIKIGSQVLKVEIADTPEKTSRGLMFRKKLLDGTGMLFIFSENRQLTFWMKNTFIPLSVGFFDENKRLINIEEMEPVKTIMEEPVQRYLSQGLARYALEVPPKWFTKHKIKQREQFSFLP